MNLRLRPRLLECGLLALWPSKQPGEVFYSPPEVIRGLLQWDYSDATNTARTPAYNPPSVAAAHRTPQDGRPSGAVGLAYLPLPLFLSLPSCKAVS